MYFQDDINMQSTKHGGKKFASVMKLSGDGEVRIIMEALPS